MLPLRIRHRLRDDTGQAVIEFALVLPLVLFVLFLIVEFGRVFNAYNDVNQMAADGARMAAVNRYPGDAQLLESADAQAVKTGATIAVSYPAGCSVGDYVRVQVDTTMTLIPFLNVSPIPLHGSAEMRVEQAPGAC